MKHESCYRTHLMVFPPPRNIFGFCYVTGWDGWVLSSLMDELCYLIIPLRSANLQVLQALCGATSSWGLVEIMTQQSQRCSFEGWILASAWYLHWILKRKNQHLETFKVSSRENNKMSEQEKEEEWFGNNRICAGIKKVSFDFSEPA